MPISKIPAFPKDQFNNLKPLKKWRGNRDAAFTQIAQRIRSEVEKIETTLPSYGPQSAFEEICERARLKDTEYDAFCITAHNLDEIYSVKDLVQDFRPNHEMDVDRPIRSPGGSGANTAYGLARLGMRVAVAGVVAADPEGNELRNSLSSVGVDDRFIRTLPGDVGSSGRTVVFTDRSDRRSIYVVQGVNERLASTVETGGLRLDEAFSSRIVHMSSFVSRRERRFCERLAVTMPPRDVFTLTPGSIYAKLGLGGLMPFLGRANVVFLYANQLRTLLERGNINLGRDVSDMSGFAIRKMIQTFFEWRSEHNHTEPVLMSIKRAGTPGSQMSASDYLTLACGRDKIEDYAYPSVGARSFGTLSHSVAYGLGAGDALASGILYSILKGRDLQTTATLGYLSASFCSTRTDARSGSPDEQTLLSALGD